MGEEGDPPLRMDFVSNLADVNVGDTIVTSGADGIYPKGFRDRQGRADRSAAVACHGIKVQPAVDFSPLEDVLVVLTAEARAGDPRGRQPSRGGPAR